jgi:flavin reductase (DIM6/NTAB) family NADH-FMN oxidoreductase RutF
MKTFKPGEVSPQEFHKILLSGVAPRPIALISTIDANGAVNLSPYSFFNAFSSNPPVVAVGPAHRGTDGTTKDTYTNLLDTGECVINAVTYSMVEQSNLSSCNFPHEVDEFVKSGFTKRASTFVKPPAVAESPFCMECKLIQMIDLGPDVKGSGNIALCSVELVHVTHSVFTGNVIDSHKMDLVGRMGLAWYARASGEAVFELPQPRWNGIGFDQLPEHIRLSTILTGNDLAKLAGVKELPKRDANFPAPEDCADAEDFKVEFNAGNPAGALHALLERPQTNQVLFRENLHKVAQLFLTQGNIEAAWQTLLLPS